MVANTYELSSLEIVKGPAGLTINEEVIQRVNKKLSLYAAAYNDRTKIISECFSGAYSSGERNKFAL